MTAVYATPLELCRFLNIEQTIPDRKATGAARGRENVGTGNGSNTTFWLDKAFIIDNSYTFYAGHQGTNGTALIDVTDYNLDKDNGEFILTPAGVTSVGTGNVSAVYSYNDLEITNTQLQESLDRAERDIDKKTNNHFAVGTDATPNYTQVTNEKHSGKGKYDRGYFLFNRPIPDVSTTVGTAVAVGDTEVEVKSTDGFLSEGTFGIETDKISYTSKSPNQFKGCTGTSAVHAVDQVVHPYVIEISNSSSGTEPSFTILNRDSDYDIDFNSGMVWLMSLDHSLVDYAFTYPPNLLPNRFRATYIWGESTIPYDIKRCCLMIAAKDLMHTTGRRTGLHGMSLPEIPALNLDETWINSTLESYKNRKHSNT